MERTELLLAKTGAISTRALKEHAAEWLLDCELRGLSPTTVANRRLLVEKLLWYLGERGAEQCGAAEVREFLAYLATGHKQPGGRWANPQLRRTVKPRTLATYYSNLRTLFRYLVSDGKLEASPLERIHPPIARADQIQPFSPSDLAMLLEAARRSLDPRRNEAVLLLLLDTGIRASELCGLCLPDLDLAGRRAVVLGKGNKHRAVFFGKVAAKALRRYLREPPAGGDGPVFRAARGSCAQQALTRSGLLQLVSRLGDRAGIRGAHPHRLRHSFAIEFLRAGGNVFALKELLGHTSLTICNRYVAYAEADIENQHRQFSPADRLRPGRGATKRRVI